MDIITSLSNAKERNSVKERRAAGRDPPATLKQYRPEAKQLGLLNAKIISQCKFMRKKL